MKFEAAKLKGDIFGGITAGVVALPLALAFGVQSGLGAIAGLYGAIALGIFAALFGGTPTQVSGPTGPMTVVSAMVIAGAFERAATPEEGLSIILMTFLLAGLFQILMGAIRLGRYIKYIPYSVLSGFMSGIGVIIILLQLFPLVGLSAPKKILDTFWLFDDLFKNMNSDAVILSAITLGIIYGLPKLTKAVPSSLVALIIGTIISVFAGFAVPIIGDIPSGLPELKVDTILMFPYTQFSYVIVPAVTLAALGAIDSLLTSVVADNITKTQHKSNKELVGQGIGNMIASIFGGIPGAGATMRTVINVNSGGSTRVSGIIHGILLLIILVGAGAYAEKIPLPVLAAILISVGIGIIDYKGLKHLRDVPRTDAAVMIIVLLMTVLIDLLQAVAVGMVLSSLLFMKKMSEIAEEKAIVGDIKDFAEEIPWDDEERIERISKKRVFIKHLDGPLFFGFTTQFKTIVRELPDVEIVVIRMMRVPYIDQSGLYAIESAVLELRGKGIHVFLSGLESQVYDMMKSIKLIPNVIPEDSVFETFDDCCIAIEKIIEKEEE